MKKLGFLLAPAVIAGLVGACGPVENTPPDAGDELPEGCADDLCEVTADIDGDTTWTTGNTYLLTKHVFVKSGTLTIEPGVTVKGGLGTSLVVTRDAKLNAVGTAASPVVFTSENDVGTRAPGNWGGVVLLGKAKINQAGGENKIEGFDPNTPGIEYGGADDAHDCGKLKYARIEFAGFELVKDKELNGLTVGGCGSATEIDYVQIHKGSDDGIEFFGGTAGMKHVVISQTEDDGLDWDYGWTGKAQFVVIQQGQGSTNFGIEADNHPNGGEPTPVSNPTIWNLTMVGSNKDPEATSKVQGAINFRRGTKASIHNAIVAFFEDHAIDVGDAATAALCDGGSLFLKNSIFFDNANLTDAFPADIMSGEAENDGGWSEGDFFLGEATNRAVDPMLENATSATAPNFAPKSGSPVTEGGATPGAGFDATATFVGAIGTTDWTAGWTAYPQN